MAPRKPLLFFAIPCGEFYSIQAKIIKDIANVGGIDTFIAEDDIQTKGLWPKIIDKICEADRFMADISSASPNITLELGYAIDRKGENNVGIFISNAVPEPSDLRGFVLQKYSSLNEFQRRLVEWICETLPSIKQSSFDSLAIEKVSFREDFLDNDIFQRRWSIPPGGAFHFSHEGLRFGNAHFPLLKKNLALLRNYEFEFVARIDRQQIGWAVKGTQHPNQLIPSFCVMFTLDNNGYLTPHIFSQNLPGPQELGFYHRYDDNRVRVDIQRDKDGWFEITTVVQGDQIEIIHAQHSIFKADFSSPPFREAYASFPQKDGQIGFRCHPNEEATVSRLVVRELI